MVAQVVFSRKATLQELRTVYTLKDLYDLWEMDYVPQYNAWKCAERAREAQEAMRMI